MRWKSGTSSVDFTEVGQKNHYERLQSFREMNQNKNIWYKSSIVQLQISSNLFVSPMRYVGKITNPVISDTCSIAVQVFIKSFWPCPLPYKFFVLIVSCAPLNFSNSISFSHWIELKHLVHTFERDMVLSLPNYRRVLDHVASCLHHGPDSPSPPPSIFIRTVLIHRAPLLNGVWRRYSLVHPPSGSNSLPVERWVSEASKKEDFFF